MIEVRSSLPAYEPLIVDTFPSLGAIDYDIFVGSFSWTAVYRRTRIMQSKDITLIEGFYLTPADLARDYIRAKYVGKRRAVSSQYKTTVAEHRKAPLFASPCLIKDAVYLDLKSAYWSILQVVGWDVDYSPDRWLGVKSSCHDFPFWRNKMARNCIVSTGLLGWGKRWDGKELSFVKKPNPLVNLVLWSLVQDVLNGIAADMVRAGAKYVHTDGYILDRRYIGDAFGVLSEWGLIGTIRHEGQAKIYGVGMYEIGSHNIKRSLYTDTPIFSSIHSRYAKWLKPHFAAFARKTVLKLA